MQELVPIFAGVILGVTTLAIGRVRVRISARVIAAVAIGAAWSTIAGEGGPLFAAWDAAQGLGAALLSSSIARRWRPAASRQSHTLGEPTRPD